jgi:phytoene synthase
MIRTGSRSFFIASKFLPGRVREAAYALYAFCRLSDDAVDCGGGPAEAVARLRSRLAKIYAGEPEAEPVDRALADTVSDFEIPKRLFDALLEGLEWDADGRSYETVDDLQDYAARVAGSVGAMMAVLMGARSADLAARACDLGTAMQLTNIARDVGEDARLGRLYLPRQWMRDAGLDPDAWLGNPVFCPEIAEVTARLLAMAEALYARSDAGIHGLDPAFRPAIFAARHLYAGIGDQLRATGLNNVDRRTVLPAHRKLRLVARALRQTASRSKVAAAGPPLPQTAFLVRAIAEHPAPDWQVGARPARTLESDVVWVISLFSGLEERTSPRRTVR